MYFAPFDYKGKFKTILINVSMDLVRHKCTDKFNAYLKISHNNVLIYDQYNHSEYDNNSEELKNIISLLINDVITNRYVEIDCKMKFIKYAGLYDEYKEKKDKNGNYIITYNAKFVDTS